MARFCWQCGAALNAPLPQREDAMRPMTARRPITVMFCDLVGSTALSTRMDPEDFSELLKSCHRLVTGIIAAHGGFTARHMGDGTLAFFGYPETQEDDAERAVQAGLAIARAMPGITVLGQKMQVRVGISTGVVIVGDVTGRGGPRGLDVAGEAPNLAARLQASPGACWSTRLLTPWRSGLSSVYPRDYFS